MTKTNAMRLLEQAHIPFRTLEYKVDETDLSGIHVAKQVNIPMEQIFKTLVVHGEKCGFMVFCIPVAEELNLKKAAAFVGDKKIELIPVKELFPLTGYLRGGCSPIAMKKKFQTFFDETALLFDEIGISAGIRGMQILLSPNSVIPYLNAKTSNFIIS